MRSFPLMQAALWPLAAPFRIGDGIILLPDGSITFPDRLKIRFGQPFRHRVGTEVWSASLAFAQTRYWRVDRCDDEGRLDESFVYEPTRVRWSHCRPCRPLPLTWGYGWLRPLPGGSLKCDGQVYRPAEAISFQRRNGVSVRKAAGLGQPILLSPVQNGLVAILFQQGEWQGVFATAELPKRSRRRRSPPVSYLPNSTTSVPELNLLSNGMVRIGARPMSQLQAIPPTAAGEWIVSKPIGEGEEISLTQPLRATTFHYAYLDRCWCQKFHWHPLHELLVDGALAIQGGQILVGPAFSKFALTEAIHFQGLYRGQPFRLKKQLGEEQFLEFMVAGQAPAYFIVWRNAAYALLPEQRPDQAPLATEWRPPRLTSRSWIAPWEQRGSWCDWLDPRFQQQSGSLLQGLAVPELPAIRLLWIGWIRMGSKLRWLADGDEFMFPGAQLRYQRFGRARYLTIALQRSNADEDGHAEWEFHQFRRYFGHWERLVQRRTWRDLLCLSFALRLALIAICLRLGILVYGWLETIQIDWSWAEQLLQRLKNAIQEL